MINISVKPIKKGAAITDKAILIPESDLVIKGARDAPALIAPNTILARIPLPFSYTVLAEDTPSVIIPECPRPAKAIASRAVNTEYWGINNANEIIATADNNKRIKFVLNLPAIKLTIILPVRMANQNMEIERPAFCISKDLAVRRNVGTHTTTTLSDMQ